MDKVKKLVSDGMPLSTAIKAILAPKTVQQFAEDHGRPFSTISKVINASIAPTDRDLEALSKEFGGTPDEWKLLLWESSKPVATV